MSMFNNILIIGKVWPEPNSSAAGIRMMQLIEYFKSENTTITFACTANPTQFQVDLESIGINVAKIELNAESFDVFARELNPTMVIFDRFMTEEQFGWRVMKECPNAIRILNTEDMHFLRDARHQALKNGKMLDLTKQSDLENKRCFREISSIYRSDLSLLVSEMEIELLKSTFQVPDHLLHFLPVFAHKTLNATPSFDERNDFIFIGNFLHEPNWDALRYLSEEIWPLIRKSIPDAIVNVYGAYPGQKVMELHKPDNGFIIHGRVNDAMEVTLKAKISLAPIRFGAGIKGKLIEAMVCGTPSVTTTIGAEAMQFKDLWNGTIADSHKSFAEAAVELHNNVDKWNQAQKNGFKIVSERFKAESHLPLFDQRLKEIDTDLDSHRSKDFTSKLMQQETVMGMKYFSMWISEKDKNQS